MSFTSKGLPMTVIIVFVAMMLSPMLMNLAGGKADVPKPELPKFEKECVESAAYMRANHMSLLDTWRNDVVRDGEREYVPHVKRDNMGPYDKSLTRTCLKCHNNKTKFCDRCHTYAGVKPYCWTCHVVPKEAK